MTTLADKLTEPHCPSPEQPLFWEQLRVVIIDDCPKMRRTLRTLLEAWDIECFTAKDGNEGFRRVLEVAPDLVITDLLMPNCDGYGLLEKLNSLHSDDRPPAIVLSSSVNTADEPSRQRLKQATHLLEKPIHPERLFECIRESLCLRD